MKKTSGKKKKKEFRNPIDKDKVAVNPHTLPYPHTIGSSVIAPIDKKGLKGSSLATVEEQAEMQLNQIRQQVELLIRQANHIKEKVAFAQRVYEADINFIPVPGEIYYMYERNEGGYVISMVAPWEWKKKIPFKAFVGAVKLMADRTWYPVTEGESQ
ncbi:MAG: hypothetical protein KatS3mg031_1346 [Chitinophagales bacterium]|nr:MAG: hypothetical protein KatS3mg031_1346 [Chitinophagales bacterium]